jgi:hypothetical protein
MERIEDKIEITDTHLNTMREKYDCGDMTDTQIIKSMIFYEERFGRKQVNILDHLAFPNFQCVLYHFKNEKYKI